jgi:hypothetical protein
LLPARKRAPARYVPLPVPDRGPAAGRTLPLAADRGGFPRFVSRFAGPLITASGMRTAVLALLGVIVSGCFAPPPPSQRVAEVAREVNTAARFGRMDVALEHTSDGLRSHFAKHRQAWGGDVRVLDVELSALSMKDTENATVVVDFQWMRVDEDTLRMTRVEQSWRGATQDHGWTLVRERRVGGDIGLFGEPVARLEAPPRDDVQFPSKTIR